jgi:hypothetical protein
LFSKQGDLGTGGRPIGIASIAVENECSGLQNVFEFFLTEFDSLIVVVGADDFKGMAITHGRSPLKVP